MHIVRAEPAPSSLPLPVAGLVANAESGKPDRDALLSSYYRLRDRVVHEAEAGHLEEALRLCDTALQVAELVADQELIDQAYCNRSDIARALGHPMDFGRLREILARSSSRVSFWASYQVACGFEKKKEYKKALFYARIAHGRAAAFKNNEYLIHSHNEMGNCLLAESHFEDAIVEYEKALALIDDSPSVFHMVLFINLAYAKIILREFTEGFRLLFKALKLCRIIRKENLYESWTHLALAYGFLEIGRFRYAWKHGRRGLDLAEFLDDREATKMALYLMGEIEKAGGDWSASYKYYERMQREFHPEMSDLAKTLMLVDTRQLVNLRA